jgi:Protein of unknown function (DUF1015).
MNRDIGVSVPEIFLPADNVDLSRWAVVACDQYTSQPDYWEKVDDLTNGQPSTYHITLPEIYLESDDCKDRIKKINTTMEKYVSEKALTSQGNCFILVKRKTSRDNERTGLILAVDLEKYDYKKGSGSLIRATEGTVEERLPPRVKVRQNALLELPHIMLLIDDPQKTVIEPLSQNVNNYEKLYDFDLMMDGGRIQGYKISDRKSVDSVMSAIENLADPDIFRDKYSLKEKKDVLLFAAGDGNHSLATAKVHWENVKKNLSASELENHPARYALVELINIHDSGLIFEPIHRVVFDAGIELISKYLSGFCDYYKCTGSIKYLKEEENLENLIGSGDENTHIIPFISGSKKGYLEFTPQPFNLEVATIQKLLDYISNSGEKIRIDYIHGSDIVEKLGSQEGNSGFYLPPMDKSKLFKTVILEGALVKKTFSMGEADEKRYYLECRKIK